MRITLVLDDTQIKQWHVRLIELLAECAGVSLGVRVCPAFPLQPRLRAAALDGLLLLERTLAGERTWLCDAADMASVRRVTGAFQETGTGDVLIDLSSRPGRWGGAGRRAFVPVLDGHAGETALWNALLEGRAPVIGLAEPAAGHTTTLALPALEAPHRLLQSAEAVLTHVIAGLTRAVAALAAGRSIPAWATSPVPAPRGESGDGIAARQLAGSALGALVQRVQKKAAEKRDALLKKAPAWQVAYRATGARTVAYDTLASDLYQLLPDDGQRYYADPFIVHHEGWHHVFVEELPYATGRGVISHFVIDADGKASMPRVVLEEPHHLSYPQVFQHEGQFWMLPEASASGRLDLYRAERFPDRWVRHATLIDAPVHDATFFTRDGMLWIFAGASLPGASSWDTLALYHAERIEGYWHAHPLNPVLVDQRCARPAGALFAHRGELWRPAQDCTGGYGSALTLNRVEKLDTGQFAQSLVTTLNFGVAGTNRGPHTINFAGGVEVIDVFQPRSTR